MWQLCRQTHKKRYCPALFLCCQPKQNSTQHNPPLGFAACDKGGNDDDNGTPATLTGTTWKTAAMDDGDNVTVTITVNFKTATTATMTWNWLDTSDGETDSDTENHTYTYNAPNIVLTNAEYPDEVVSGTVNGRTMTFEIPGDIDIVFTKQ